MTDAQPPRPTEVEIRDDTVIAVARRYAEALIDAAQKEGQAEPALDELAEIETDVFAGSPVRRAPRLGARPGGREGSHPHRSVRRPGAPSWSSDSSACSIATAAGAAPADRRGRPGRSGTGATIAIPVSVRTAVPLDDDQTQALRDRLRAWSPARRS